MAAHGYNQYNSKTWNDATVAQLRELWLKGLTVKLIADKMGLTVGKVIGKATRLKFPARGHGFGVLRGPDNPRWNGGRRAAMDRHNARRREMGTNRKRDVKVMKPGRICFLNNWYK